MFVLIKSNWIYAVNMSFSWLALGQILCFFCTVALRSNRFNIFSNHVGTFLFPSLFLNSHGFKTMNLIVFVCFSHDYFNCLINTSKAFILFYFIFISFPTMLVYENSAAVKLASAAPFTCYTADVNGSVCVNFTQRTNMCLCTSPPFTAFFFFFFFFFISM